MKKSMWRIRETTVQNAQRNDYNCKLLRVRSACSGVVDSKVT